MKKTRLLFFVLFLFPFLSFSQTQVSGNIRSNTIWTKANSPYVLTGTVGVPSAYTLTIEAGVTIQRTDNYQILVNGALITNGNSEDSVILSSGPSITDWSSPFIEFQKSNLDNSNLRFITFKSPGQRTNNIRLGGYQQTSPTNLGTLKIARSNISNGYTSTQGINAAKSMNIDSSVLTSALLVSHASAEKIDVSNSTITSSTIQSFTGLSFTNCFLSDDKFMAGSAESYLIFISSKISSSDMPNGGSGGIWVIKNCLLYNNPIYGGNGSYFVSRTKFVINKQLANQSGYPVNNVIEAATISMFNSEIINNSGSNYTGISLSGQPLNASDTITNNSFSNLYDAVSIRNFSLADVSSNNFKTIGRYGIANFSIKDFSALNNYYELKSGQSVDDVIFDNNDDLNYGTVYYSPYSTSPVATTPVAQPKNVTKELSVDGNVIVRWEGSTQARSARAARSTAAGGYKVYWGYIDPFTYAHEITVPAGTFQAVLNGALITDSIAVTAIDPTATGTNDQLAGKESWYAPATIQASTLPIKLITFNAVALTGKTQLIWETNTEVYNDHFDIEYSEDGITFNKIGTVRGVGNNQVNSSYSFVHNASSGGNKYYRLKQVDKDGQFEYSNIVKVKSDVDRGLAVYPNPAVSMINVVSSLPIVHVSIINGAGQSIKKINGGNSLLLKINISDIPAGFYRIVITNQNQEIKNASFIKQ